MVVSRTFIVVQETSTQQPLSCSESPDGHDPSKEKTTIAIHVIFIDKEKEK